MKIKTSELTGAALDWMVAKCEGQALLDPHNNEWEYCWNLLGDNSGDYYSPSTNWAQGGPLIQMYEIDLKVVEEGMWQASNFFNDLAIHRFVGYSPLEAAMRCYVAFKLGDEVEIPENLLP